MGRRATVIAIAAVLGLVAWWLVRAPTPIMPAIANTGAPDLSRDAGPAPEPLAQSKPAERTITPTALQEAPADRAATRAGRMTLLRGRCVDARSGAPLAGCAASLHGFEASADRMDAHLGRYGPVEWKDPDGVTTAADGRFEIRFVPPGPYRFVLGVSAPSRAPMEARWQYVEPGAAIDVGDVLMQTGASVTGRVTDSAGRPQAAVPLAFLSTTPGPTRGAGLRRTHDAVSGPDGTFRVATTMPAGAFRLEAREKFTLVEPLTVEIAEGETERSIEVKVDVDAEGNAIQGFVRDDEGKPVRGVRVDVEPRGTDSAGWERLATTGADGGFRIQRVNQPADVAVSISASHSEYDPIGPFRFEWGRKDVVLVLRRGPAVEIAVRDGDRDEPLERYGVRVFEAPPGPRRRSPDAFRIRESGHHPGGVLQLRGVRTGRQVLVVEAEGPDRSPTIAQEFEMSASGAPRQEVTVRRNVKKTVRVKRADGSPVRGSKVDLVRRFSATPVDERTRALEASQAYLFAPVHALQIDAGETNENGAAELSGPPRETLTVRALGPGHVPIVRDVDFGAAEVVIDLVVAGGATFVGKVGPPELLAQLEPAAFPKRGSRAGMYLVKTSSSEYDGRFPLHFGVVPFEADGSFRCEGIPPGSWDVRVSYMEASGPGGWKTGSLKIATVDLADGQERHESYDLAHLLQAEIEGVVTLDGKPLEDARVVMFGRQQLAGGESASVDSPIIKPGPGGKFRTTVWPAEYFLIATVVRDGRDVDLHDSTYFRVGPGEKLARTFELRSSVLKLRVVASDGVTPVSGVRLMFEVPRIYWPSDARPTDADGRVEFEGLPALPVTVLTWPKELSTQEARETFFRTSKVGPEKVRVRVTTVTATPPETSATIVLPASAGY